MFIMAHTPLPAKELQTLVAAKNISLDNKIRQQITAAINSFSTITISYERQYLISVRK